MTLHRIFGTHNRAGEWQLLPSLLRTMGLLDPEGKNAV